MKSNYQKLSEIITETEGLLNENITASSPKFSAWETKVERFLIHLFGDNSLECKKFKEENFTLHFYSLTTPNSAFVNTCHSGIERTLETLKVYLKELEESPVINELTMNNHYDKIFIVHGHDGELKQAVARIIEKQGIEAIILSEQANKGRTIIEKFEDYSDVSGAICLFTADDYGRAKNNATDNTRARQNVVLEAGYFMGKLGRNCVAILADKDIEMPSDLSGIVYTDSTNWEINLLKELKEMGYTIDFNKLF